MPTAPLRRVVGALLSLVLAGLVVAGTAAPAQAEDGYRYWNYFHLTDGAWTFSDKGVGQYAAKDGDVEGLRFGTSTASAGVEPRADLDQVTFEAVCPEPAPAGQKRVALVVDYGTAADADGAEVPEPTAQCAVVPEKSTTLQAVESVLDVRVEGGMLCAVDGYPAKGCGEPVKNAQVPAEEDSVAFALPASGGAEETGDAAPAAASDDGSDLTWPLVGVAAAVLVIAGAAVALNRRRADA